MPKGVNKTTAAVKRSNPNGSVKLGNTIYGYKPKRKGQDTTRIVPVEMPKIETPANINTTAGGKKVGTTGLVGKAISTKAATPVPDMNLLEGETNEQYNQRLGLTPNDAGYRRGGSTAEPFAFKDTAEEAFYRVSGGVEETSKLAKELGFESYSELPTNLKGFVDQFIEQQQKSDMEMAQYEKQIADILDERSIEQTRTAGASQAAATEASLLSGREGFQGGTEVGAVRQFKDLIVTQIDSAQKRVDLAKAQREKALIDLQRAQDKQDFDAAETIQGRIAQAEAAIRQETSNMIELEQRGAQIALDEIATLGAEQRASFNTFQSLMETGVVMDMPALLSMSNSLGLPADVVYSAYTGMQAIRDDKSLSLQEKQIGIEQQMNQLRDYQLGLSSEEAKRVDDYLKLSQSGNYTPEELQTYAIAMNIPNDKNPVWQTEQQMKALQYDIAQKQAQGIPTSISEYQQLIELQQQQNAFYGVGGEAYVPNKSLEGFDVSYEGGGLVITQDGGFKPYQCGAFVNRVWGLSSGGIGGFGNSIASKQSIVDSRGINADNVTLMNYKSLLKPGMAFVENGGTTGHVGIITAIGEDGYFTVMEANVGSGSNSGPGTVPTTGTRNIQNGSIYGYAPPPNYTAVGSQGKENTFDYEVALTSLDLGSVANQEKALETMKSLLSSGETKKAQDYLKAQIFNSSTSGERETLEGKTNTLRALDTISSKMQQFIDKGGDLNIFTGVKEKALQKGGLTSDPQLAELANDIALAIVDYRRAVSGAAFTESEAAAYEAIFPSAGKTPELNMAKIKSLQEKLQGDADAYYKNRIGEDLYSSIFNERPTGVVETTVDDSSLYKTLYEKTSSLGDSYTDQINEWFPGW